MTVQYDLGLSEITVAEASNASVSIPPFAPGATQVVVTATKTDPNSGSRVVLQSTTTEGCVFIGDPVYTGVLGKAERQSFPGLPAAEHYVTILNGKPGVRKVIVEVNRKKFRELSLADNEVRRFSVASHMSGDNNTVTVWERACSTSRRTSSSLIPTSPEAMRARRPSCQVAVEERHSPPHREGPLRPERVLLPVVPDQPCVRPRGLEGRERLARPRAGRCRRPSRGG